MFEALTERLRAAVPRGRRTRARFSVLLPFVIISIGLGGLALRSYNLSVRAEQGAMALAEQYAGYAAEITASRVDAAIRAEMANAAEEWQQMERRTGEPTFAALRTWIAQNEWIVTGIYVPDDDPASSIYGTESKSASRSTPLRMTREFFTASGTVKYTYDPERLLLEVGGAVRQPPLQRIGTPRGIAQQADVSLVQGSRSGIEKLRDGFAAVAKLAPPMQDFGVKALVRTSYVSGTGWQNQRVMSLWLSLIALALTGAGTMLAMRGLSKEADTMKLRGALIANVSHELRTPLSMIRLGAETLKRGKLKDHERQDIEDQILREVLLLSHLVENVLDVARIQNQTTTALAFTPVQPRDLIRNLTSTYESWIRSKGFTVTLDLDETIGPQMWDRDAVSRALLNLIDNAIKYSNEDRSIAIVLRQTAEYVVIEVRDRGVGIESKDLVKIFDPYYRARFSDTSTRRGAGLGLTLVQQILASHGGKVELESVFGSGSTFRLMFPVALGSGDAPERVSMGRAREAF
jgi:signal transduction histidine kinase